MRDSISRRILLSSRLLSQFVSSQGKYLIPNTYRIEECFERGAGWGQSLFKLLTRSCEHRQSFNVRQWRKLSVLPCTSSLDLSDKQECKCMLVVSVAHNEEVTITTSLLRWLLPHLSWNTFAQHSLLDQFRLALWRWESVDKVIRRRIKCKCLDSVSTWNWKHFLDRDLAVGVYARKKLRELQICNGCHVCHYCDRECRPRHKAFCGSNMTDILAAAGCDVTVTSSSSSSIMAKTSRYRKQMGTLPNWSTTVEPL